MITRNLTISYATDGRFRFMNGEIIPKLKISNRFLALSGFGVGSRCSVEYHDEMLIIKKIKT